MVETPFPVFYLKSDLPFLTKWRPKNWVERVRARFTQFSVIFPPEGE
jgi:hypothetical protein